MKRQTKNMLDRMPQPRLTRRFLLSASLTAVAIAWASSLHAEPLPQSDSVVKSPVKTVRLLTVGNSFSANATHYLAPLAKAAGHTLIHRPLVVGGASMELHVGMADRFEKDPGDAKGLYGGKSLVQYLDSDRWDFVTIQQASFKSFDLATYRPFADKLAAIIHKHAPQARLLVHQTWAYRCDDPWFTAKQPAPGVPNSQAAMYQSLTAAYHTIATELGTAILPVGDAFHLADCDPTWGYRPDPSFDPKTAQSPALPDQSRSLHVGRQWKTDKDGHASLAMDGHHANTAGEYLGACVFFEVLFQENVVGNTLIPAGLDPAYARFLQETAHRAVAERPAQFR
jgi:hypothetical protein